MAVNSRDALGAIPKPEDASFGATTSLSTLFASASFAFFLFSRFFILARFLFTSESSLSGSLSRLLKEESSSDSNCAICFWLFFSSFFFVPTSLF